MVPMTRGPMGWSIYLVEGQREERNKTYIPQKATSTVANRKEPAKGARIMAPENMNCPANQVVKRSGLYLANFLTKSAMAPGGRGVNEWSSGERTNRGMSQAPANVTAEKTTRDILPMRPISPNASLDSFTSSGASYL